MPDAAWARECWFLVGPTASGKSAAGLALAEALGAEIVALDSMTLYRGMEIGSAMPTPADRRRVPHQLVDLLEPSDSASLAWYLDAAAAAAAGIAARGRRVLFVGGTPLYLKACLHGMFEGPGADPALRAELEAEAAALGASALHARMATIDPAAAERIKPNDLRRVVRALEVHRLTGTPISAWQQEFARPAEPPPRVACLHWPTAELNQRIAARVDGMLAAGWLEETRALLARRPPPSREARQAIGYAELAGVLAGTRSLADAREAIVVRTRQFAKRQRTWFRHLSECVAFPVSAAAPPEAQLPALRAFFAG